MSTPSINIRAAHVVRTVHALQSSQAYSTLSTLFTPACAPPAYIAAYLSVALLPEYCLDATMDDKTLYPTLVRLTGSWSAMGDAFVALLVTTYSWHNVVFLSDTSTGLHFPSDNSSDLHFLLSDILSGLHLLFDTSPGLHFLSIYLCCVTCAVIRYKFLIGDLFFA